MIETFATDEHRIGLKPITRRVWAQRGARPVAPCHHRFEWLYVTAFVSPATGESFWYLSTGVDKDLVTETLALFAREVGSDWDRRCIRLRHSHDQSRLAPPRLPGRRGESVAAAE